MKNLYLHIGCGKTGSSALQVWLGNNTEELNRAGYHYPLFGGGAPGEYEITVGNGLPLHNAIASNDLPEMIEKVFSKDARNVILSSEVFQNLDEKGAAYLNEVCKNNEIIVHIIAYVRDVYDITYSSYLQLLKRRTYTASYSEFALGRTNIQQFSVVSLYEKVFDDISLIHYDSEKKHGLDKSFCREIGLDANLIPGMKKTIVNRSLTVKESQLLIMAKRAYLRQSKFDGENFSDYISKFLISSSPERDTEIYFNRKIMSHFEDTFGDDVNYINDKYFNDNQLKIFDPAGKNIVDHIEPIDSDSRIIIEALVSFSAKNKVQQAMCGESIDPTFTTGRWGHRLFKAKNVFERKLDDLFGA